MLSKKKIINGLIIAAMAVAVVVIIVLYAIFMQDRIFDESANHLSEVYGQTNAALQQRIDSHRNIMNSWESYIFEKAQNPDKKEQQEFETFIDTQKKNLNVTRFSFINTTNMSLPQGDEDKDKIYAMDRDGRQYLLELRRSPQYLFKEGEDAAVACMRIYVPGTGVEVRDKYGSVIAPKGQPRNDYNEKDRFITIAVMFDGFHYYTASGDDRAFGYNGIAFFFDVEDISYSIEVDAFEGQGSTFLVLPNGVDESSKSLVLLQSTNNTELFDYSFSEAWKFSDFLRDKTKLSNSKIKSLEKQWDDWSKDREQSTDGTKIVHSDTIIFKANDGKEYYMNYRLVGYSNWIMVGVVPANVVNESMTSLRTLTIIVMAAIFIVLGGGVAWFIIMSNKRKMQDKELAIKSREGLLDLLTFNSKDIFALFDANMGDAEYVSANVESVLGIPVDEAKKDAYKILEAATVPFNELLQNSAQVLSEGIVIEELCMKNAQNNSEIWYRLVINPTHGKSGYVLMLSDRTKERQMRADLEAALAIAKSANEAKSNFLSNMSHDIRTPMNAIIGFATLLEKDAENPDKVREYIRKISFSSHHMLSLINDILDMSKIESGKSALHIEEFALPDMLEEIYTIISTQVASKKQKFEMHTKGAIPELVNGDRLRLNQVMINLLSNAVKYTPVGGEIDLTVEALPESVRNHAHLRFIVKDNGLGMSEEFVKVIFEPFSRETTAYTKEIQGTGLGMAITKQIVDLMGGTISVKSKLGEGSEFIVEIELSKVALTDKDVKEFWTKHNIRRMLVVDDEKDVCIEVKELMHDTGVKVDYATSGQEALEMLSKQQSGKTKYDIVLLDWKMPEMDGLETAKRMHENIDSQLPIMVLTSYNFEEIADEAKKTGINVFLSKPFFVSNFRNAVAKLQDDEEEKGEEEEEASLEGLNILAAEDNPINAEILGELLDIEGATCTICENGKVAVETFEKSAPGTYNMIFMDVQMPIMNGHEASKAIRASSHPEAKTIPIIAMTANAFDDDKKMAFDAGMNAHVAKPIDMSVLKKTVAKLRGEHNE